MKKPRPWGRGKDHNESSVDYTKGIQVARKGASFVVV